MRKPAHAGFLVFGLRKIEWRAAGPPLTIRYPLTAIRFPMLQQIRDKITGWFAAVFLGAIAIVFIFWGIQFESSVNVAAAKVNGEKIPVEAVRRAWQDRQTELQQVLRDELPPRAGQDRAAAAARGLHPPRTAGAARRRARLPGERPRSWSRRIAAIPRCRWTASSPATATPRCCARRAAPRREFEAEFRRDLEISQLQQRRGVSAFALPGELSRRIAARGRDPRRADVCVLPAAGFAAGVDGDRRAGRGLVREERKAELPHAGSRRPAVRAAQPARTSRPASR